MKFKDDGCGWRDLRLVNGSEELQASIPTKKAGRGAQPFISCGEFYQYASVSMSRAQMRAFATKILKELSK